MQKIGALNVSILSFIGLTGFVAQQQLEYNPSNGNVCIYDKGIPSKCVPIGTLDSILHTFGPVAVPSPSWSTYTTQYTPIIYNIGALPKTSMFGGLGITGGYTSGGSTVALTAALDTPAEDTALLEPGDVEGHINAAFQGVARTASTVKGVVGVFGGGMGNAEGTSQWGGNFVVTNFPTLGAQPDGFMNYRATGAEIDVYINDAAGGVATNGTAIGLQIYGAVAHRPGGGLRGINIGGVGNSSIGWDCALCLEDVPNTYGILVGAHGKDATDSSQEIKFKARIDDVETYSSMFGDIYGGLTMASTNGVNFLINGSYSTKITQNGLWIGSPSGTSQYSYPLTLEAKTSGESTTTGKIQVDPYGNIYINSSNGAEFVAGTTITAQFTARTASFSGTIAPGAGLKLKSTVVGSLPTCDSGTAGQVYYVTDAASPTWNTALTGGGSTATMALCNGSSWTAH